MNHPQQGPLPDPASSDQARRRGSRPRRSGAKARLGTGVALLGAAVLALTGCTGSGPGPASEPDASSSHSAAVPKGLQEFYSQEVSWDECGSHQCAKIEAPMDYEHPSQKKIELSLIRLPASGTKQGSLVVNPGGPGGSGVEFVKGSAQLAISKKVRSAYDVVGFDPRGVGESTSVVCRSRDQNDKDREKARVPTTSDGVEAMVHSAQEYANDCGRNTPEGLLKHVDTESSTKDLDLIRAVLGEDSLDYLGYSYGTKLGANYLRLFPENADRLVLDGALDPTLQETDVATGQAQAFEKSLDRFLQRCLDGDECPFSGSVEDARGQLEKFLADADRHPLPTGDGRVVPASDIVSGLLLALYEPSQAPTVIQSLSAGMNGDGSMLLMLADISAERDNDGKYSNSDDAFTAINCADYQRVSGKVADIQAREQKLSKKAPFFGRYLGYDDGCSTWPEQAVDPVDDFSVPDSAAPALVVGTTGDPATPYQWSQAMQKLLPGSKLLTYKGEGHTAYGRSNSCVVDAVDSYLLKGTLPKQDPTC